MGVDPPHSARYVLLRVLGALLILGGAVALKQTILTDDAEALQTFGAKIKEVTIDSELLGEEMPAEVVVPESAQQGRRRSLVVFLHERGGDESSYLDDELLRTLDRTGSDAPIIAFPRGGPDSYWHDRDDGAWGSYVLDEVVPRLRRRFDVKPGRVALAGISMGGYGAFNLARQQPEKFCAVAGHSPAVWERAGDTAPGAFDDEADFAANDVIAAISSGSALQGKRTWIDVGTDDPFADADRALQGALLRTGARTERRLSWSGGHESAYWGDHWRSYVRFYERSLTACVKADRERREAAGGTATAAGGEPGAEAGGGSATP